MLKMTKWMRVSGYTCKCEKCKKFLEVDLEDATFSETELVPIKNGIALICQFCGHKNSYTWDKIETQYE